MAIDLSEYRDYQCADCRSRCLRPENSEESLRDLCVDCLRAGRVLDWPHGHRFVHRFPLFWYLLDIDYNARRGRAGPVGNPVSRPRSLRGLPEAGAYPHCDEGDSESCERENEQTRYLKGRQVSLNAFSMEGAHGD